MPITLRTLNAELMLLLLAVVLFSCSGPDQGTRTRADIYYGSWDRAEDGTWHKTGGGSWHSDDDER
jgi:hypothetical protein